MKITKADFVASVAHRTGLSRYKVNKVLDEMIRSLKSIVADGNSVGFLNFGVFGSIRKAAMRRRPFGGELKVYPARRVPYFKVSRKWRDAVSSKGQHPAESD